jgi:gamma-glutamylcyclotransferase (GGCT)/AIG2-like uncharacterized protein YtfP
VSTESVWLFVYGSLKRGERHHAELRGAAFMGKARTVEGYGLEAIGEYSALVERPGWVGSVSGELFEVDEPLLRLLDQFEGDDYRRGVVRLASAGDAGDAVGAGGAKRSQTTNMTETMSQSTGSAEFREIRLALAYLKRTR